MKLNGQNKSIELWTVNYQFPDNLDEYYDSNWLIIGIRLNELEKKLITSDPSLLTSECQKLADWLKQILQDKRQNKKIGFIEPNFEFELVDTQDNNFTIRTYLNLESKPKWYNDDWGYSIDITVDKGQIENCIKRIKADLIRFPERPVG